MGCVVLLSGGMDSTICLARAVEAGPAVALAIDYGQRHKRELDAAEAVARFFRVPLERACLALPALGDALTDHARAIRLGAGRLPTTFVPGRNALFLSIAAGLAYAHDFDRVVIGCSQVDYSGYPDCREGFLREMQAALELGLDRQITVEAPLLHLTKTAALQLVAGTLAWPALGLSWSCYRGSAVPCDACPACGLRAQGFAEAGLLDPAREGL